MNYARLYTERQAQLALSDAEFIAYANTTLYSPSPAPFASYRKIRYVLGNYYASQGTDALSADIQARTKIGNIQQFVQAVDPMADQLLSIPGDEKGVSGGVDVSLPSAQAMIDALAQQGVLDEGEATILKNLGRVGRLRCSDWGCERAILDGDLAEAIIAGARTATDLALDSLKSRIDNACTKLVLIREGLIAQANNATTAEELNSIADTAEAITAEDMVAAIMS